MTPARSGIDADLVHQAIQDRYGKQFAEWARDVAASIRGIGGSLPIVARDAAASLRVVIKTLEDPGALGSTTPQGSDEYLIQVSPGQSLAQENFTVAHELGHVLLHRAFDGRFVDGPQVETACDVIAAHMLCPLTFVDASLRKHGLNLETTSLISRELRIPEEQLWLFLSIYYPSTYFSGLEPQDAVGQFSLQPFAEAVRDLMSADPVGGRITVCRKSEGVDQWSLEVAPNDAGGLRGILKPFGRGVKSQWPVRGIGKVRSIAMGERTEEWRMNLDPPEPFDR